MEFTKIEASLVQQAVAAKEQEDQVELNELQLALVGGGVGEAVLG